MKTNADDFYFDDCPICQAQKKADQENRPIFEYELRKSMRAAEKLGAAVFIAPRATKRMK